MKLVRDLGILKNFLRVGILAVISLSIIESVASRPSPSPTTSIIKPGCKIKGNISITTRKKLYHLPGMRDYEITRIDPTKGERWFCTEAEAKSKGWIKAPR